MGFGWGPGRRRRRKRAGRPRKEAIIKSQFDIEKLTPFPNPSNVEPILLSLEELEALRLVDLEGLSQEEAGESMGVSRSTVWRYLQSARKKVVKAITESRELRVIPK